MVGGITGYSGPGTIKNCYSTGTIESPRISSQSKQLGGIVGWLMSDGTVENCYNIGSLITGDNNENNYVGGVIGNKRDSSATITNCYYLSGIVSGGIGERNSNPYDADGQTKSITTAQCQNTNTFTGWDFINVWEMGGDYLSRPVLKNNKEIANGEEETPYQIYSLADLEKLSSNIGTANYSGKYFKLMADINMSEKYGAGKGENGANLYWTPIGANGTPFDGIFDGNGKTVSNVYTNNENDYQGLFGYVDNGTVKNLAVSGTIKGKEKVGAIAGYLENGLIENCHNTATTAVKGQEMFVGGIVGLIKTEQGTVRNCSNSATVSNNYLTHIGGITGQNFGTTEMCVNKGSVSASEGKGGGIVGVNSGTLRNCYNQGSVDGREHIGGIVGYNAVKTENCYSVGDVKSNDYNSSRGSIAGTNGSRNDVSGVITNCYYLSTRIGGISKAQVVGSAESRANEEFKNGSVAWALQDAQVEDSETQTIPQVWGQSIGSDNYPDLTNDSTKKVYKVTFVKKNTDPTVEELYVEHDARYTNGGGKLTSMPSNPTSENYTFKSWVYDYDEPENTFNENTVVNSDIDVYALGSEISQGSDNPPRDKEEYSS